MAVVAVVGRKGGIGKSTIAGNLAAHLAELGKSVRVLDADPQHSVAAWAEQGDGLLAGCVEKVRDGELRKRVRAAESEADIVLIDTPPASPEVAFEAALLADLALLPCGASPLDLFATKESISLMLKARAQRRAKRPRIRLVPSRVQANTRLGRGLADALGNTGRKLLPGISQRTALAEAVLSGQTVLEYARDSVASAEFGELAKAVMAILRKSE